LNLLGAFLGRALVVKIGEAPSATKVGLSVARSFDSLIARVSSRPRVSITPGLNL
jgi:hypothetical protein